MNFDEISIIQKLINSYHLIQSMGSQIPRICSTCSSPSPRNLCVGCKTYACDKCFDFPVLKPYQGEFSVKSIDYYSACVQCFLNKTDLDFSTTYQIVGDQNKKEIIFLHGAGSSRKMFLPHARQLAKKGYRSILIDLPGHGARYKQDLTMANCADAIKEAIRLCKTKDFTIAGGSLGGYILMQFIGREPELCQKAVVMMAGQDVGINRGMLASFGLWAMGKATNFSSQAGIAKMFMQTAAGNKNLNIKMIEQLSRCGVFFKHSEQNIILLKETNPRLSLTQAKNTKCLFINGEKDHRNSENIWLESATKGSKLIVYEGGDHFFSHDNRFFERLIQDIQKFTSQE